MTQRVTLNISCPQEFVDAVKEAAWKQRRTVSGFIRNVIQNELQTLPK